MRVGYLLHVYNLGCKDWEELVWGVPEQDKLGTGTKLFECLLDEPAGNEVLTVVYSGPSSKDGLSEGAYTKQFLQSRLARLDEFPRFKRRFAHMLPAERELFKRRVEGISLGEPIKNTLAEVEQAAKLFQREKADKVIHIAAASHAPRCVLIQSLARESGAIIPMQPWFTVASDISFAGRTAADTMVIEPPHRADDPLLDVSPTLAQVLEPFFYALSPAQQQEFLHLAARDMAALATKKLE